MPIAAVTTVAGAERTRCLAGQSADCAFNVANTSGKSVRLSLEPRVEAPAERGWFELIGEVERDVPEAGSDQVRVRVHIPEDATAGKYSFRLRAYATDDPEQFADSPTVAIDVPVPTKPAPALAPPSNKPLPWRIIATVGAVLLVVGGVLAIVFWPTDDPELVFKSIDVANPPYCDRAGSPEPRPVPTKDASGMPNLALLLNARASASSVTHDPSGSRHRTAYINDGWYNNCRSWIPATMPAWAEIDLGSEFRIEAVALGSEHEAYYKDRAATKFKISVFSNRVSNEWRTVYTHSSGEPIRDTTLFDFDPVVARKIKIDITKSIPNPVRIDEMEVYGRPLKR